MVGMFPLILTVLSRDDNGGGAVILIKDLVQGGTSQARSRVECRRRCLNQGFPGLCGCLLDRGARTESNPIVESCVDNKP